MSEQPTNCPGLSDLRTFGRDRARWPARPLRVARTNREGRHGGGVQALDERLNRIVAVKVLAPALADGESARQRFIREARAAAAICHEHVVTIHAVDESAGQPYIVMQLVAGESLQEKLDRSGAWPSAISSGSACKSPWAWPRLMPRAWFIETSSQPTFCSRRRRPREDHRLRVGASGRRRQPDNQRNPGGHAELYVARASPRRGGRPVDRPLQSGQHVVRDVHRRAAVPGRDGRGCVAQGQRRRATADRPTEPRGARLADRNHRQADAKGTWRAIPVGSPSCRSSGRASHPARAANATSLGPDRESQYALASFRSGFREWPLFSSTIGWLAVAIAVLSCVEFQPTDLAASAAVRSTCAARQRPRHRIRRRAGHSIVAKNVPRDPVMSKTSLRWPRKRPRNASRSALSSFMTNQSAAIRRTPRHSCVAPCYRRAIQSRTGRRHCRHD